MELEKAKKSLEEVKSYKVYVNGYDTPLYATERQAKLIIKLANNTDTRCNLVTLGNQTFKPISVQRMEEFKCRRYDLPVYVCKRIDEERTGGLIPF